MIQKGFQQYKERAVSTMTQGELLLLLYSELSKRIIQAELLLKKEDYPAFENALDRAMDIIHYLDDTLDMQYEISHNLTRLYEYFLYELGRAKIGRRLEVIENVHSMVKELQDSFDQAQKQVNTEAHT